MKLLYKYAGRIALSSLMLFFIILIFLVGDVWAQGSPPSPIYWKIVGDSLVLRDISKWLAVDSLTVNEALIVDGYISVSGTVDGVDISTIPSTYEVQLTNEAGLYTVLSDVSNFVQDAEVPGLETDAAHDNFSEIAGDVNLATQVTGTLPEANGGTGDTDLDDIVAGTGVTVTGGANTIIGGNATIDVNVPVSDSTVGHAETADSAGIAGSVTGTLGGYNVDFGGDFSVDGRIMQNNYEGMTKHGRWNFENAYVIIPNLSDTIVFNFRRPVDFDGREDTAIIIDTAMSAANANQGLHPGIVVFPDLHGPNIGDMFIGYDTVWYSSLSDTGWYGDKNRVPSGWTEGIKLQLDTIYVTEDCRYRYMLFVTPLPGGGDSWEDPYVYVSMWPDSGWHKISVTGVDSTQENGDEGAATYVQRGDILISAEPIFNYEEVFGGAGHAADCEAIVSKDGSSVFLYFITTVFGIGCVESQDGASWLTGEIDTIVDTYQNPICPTVAYDGTSDDLYLWYGKSGNLYLRVKCPGPGEKPYKRYWDRDTTWWDNNIPYYVSATQCDGACDSSEVSAVAFDDTTDCHGACDSAIMIIDTCLFLNPITHTWSTSVYFPPNYFGSGVGDTLVWHSKVRAMGNDAGFILGYYATGQNWFTQYEQYWCTSYDGKHWFWAGRTNPTDGGGSSSRLGSCYRWDFVPQKDINGNKSIGMWMTYASTVNAKQCVIYTEMYFDMVDFFVPILNPASTPDSFPTIYFDEMKYPYGGKLEKISLSLPEAAVCTLTVQEVHAFPDSGKAPVLDNITEVIITSVDSAGKSVYWWDIDDPYFNAGDWIYLKRDAGDFDWIHFKGKIRPLRVDEGTP